MSDGSAAVSLRMASVSFQSYIMYAQGHFRHTRTHHQLGENDKERPKDDTASTDKQSRSEVNKVARVGKEGKVPAQMGKERGVRTRSRYVRQIWR